MSHDEQATSARPGGSGSLDPEWRRPLRNERRNGQRTVPHKATRRPWRRFLVLSHRWLSLTLGLVLLLVTTTGSVLLYQPEIHRWLNRDAFAASTTTSRASVSLAQAAATVARTHPSFQATDVIRAHGVIVVTDDTDGWTVDPGTGKVLGHVAPLPGWLSWTENLHECFLTCEGETGYLSVLTEPVPGTAFLSTEDPAADVTWGGLVLGLLGVLLLWLCLSGLWLWLPRPRRWRSGFTVRRGKGRFARDTDLHKVIGVAALLPLAAWAFTGAGYEVEQPGQLWYAALPGSEQPAPTATPSGSTGATISMAQAQGAAQRAVPGGTVRSVSVIAEGDEKTAYSVWLSSAHDPYAETDYPGDIGVDVDQHTGRATVTYGQAGTPDSQRLWQTWNYPTHSGYVVNGWWRLLWLALGLTPLALAGTGLSTWLVRRRSKKRRRAAQRLRRRERSVATA